MRKVIKRIHILKQRTFLQITHSTGLPHRIESVGSLIRPLIKCIVILGFVDAHAPQNNGRMIPVLHHHVFCVPHGLILPFRTTDVLPPRNLREHQKPQFIAPVKEMM